MILNDGVYSSFYFFFLQLIPYLHFQGWFWGLFGHTTETTKKRVL